MSSRFVDLEALNLRSAPIVEPATRLGILHLGQPVEVLGPHEQAGWTRVRASIDGAAVSGMVKSEIGGQPSLREPAPPAREALVAAAVGQWLRFEQGLGQEHLAPYYRYVGEMWRAIGIDLDGRDRDTPWSAAAISFMVRQAGHDFPRYRDFRFAAAHSKYLHDAIAKRRANDADAPFWGFRLHERRPEIGDLVCRWRETPRDFDDAASSDAFKSHSDIVVSVAPDFVLAIGGNVGQSVNVTRYEKTGAGFLAAAEAVFMLLGNRT
ncbi:DUF2272 domain-containing protein [Chitinimonas koreensis]|uniref:DUF2272 domain-containing protein n=1 Tax=Chitinimonas koreensis TaxID=356302 RepID=UPI0003F7E79A|nr:DUF2272 domain-containing protein [Chitinimonas koreensis]QNM98642.1 DUF2272 domain-containing protein [Chitinimonas koreensis]